MKNVINILLVFSAIGLSLFVSVYFLPLFIVLSLYLSRGQYEKNIVKLQYKTSQLENLVKVETILNRVYSIILVSIIVLINRRIIESNLIYFVFLLVLLLPLIYIDLKKRRLLAIEKIKEETY